MKVFTIKNISSFRIQINSKGLGKFPGIIYNLEPKAEIKLYESQLSGDVDLKLKKRIISVVESQENSVISSFSDNSNVEAPTIENMPQQAQRGRKKKKI